MSISLTNTSARDFWKVIKVLKSCKTFAQFLSAEEMYNNYKKLHFGITLYDYHDYDELWDEVWYEVLEKVTSGEKEEDAEEQVLS